MTTAEKPTKKARFAHQRVSEHVRELVSAGQLKPGDPLPSERELSRQFSLSHLTVRKGLAALVKEGLIERQIGRGTFVSDGKTISSRPATQKTARRTIAFAISHQSTELPVVGHCLAGAREVFGQDEFALEVLGIGDQGVDEPFFNILKEHHIEGLIFQGYLGPQDCQIFSDMKFPVVSIGGNVGSPDIGHIYLDTDRLFDELIREIYRFGHRRIAMVRWAVPKEVFTSKAIKRETVTDSSYESSCRRYNLLSSVTEQYRIPPAGRPDPSVVKAQPMLEIESKPTCLIVNDEVMAAALMRDAEAMSIRVPDDLSIVALFDGTPHLYRVPLTAPMTQEAIGRRCKMAAELLSSMIEGHAPAELHQPFMPTVEYRASLAPAPGWRVEG